MKWECVIGLETHVELATASKVFCGCATAFGARPNTQCCPVCAGLPGAMPTLNEKALEYAVLAALALDCKLTETARFDRKNYFYPDLPKAYQISQYHHPLARGGAVTLKTGQTIRICEMHLEEDAGKLLHDPVENRTGIDFNRCGVPLIEIVTEPDFRTGDAVVSYLEQLKSILHYLGVSDCKMQEGSLRCDVNLSVRPMGTQALGTRTEMKNLGSFRAVARAIDHESRRQIAILEGGGCIPCETRRWDEDKNTSHAMRPKERAGDYRYFPEPDIPPIALTAAYVNRLRAKLPEQGAARSTRYQRAFGLSAQDGAQLTAQRALAEFFEDTTALGAQPKEAANWILSHVLRKCAETATDAKEMAFTPKTLARLIALVADGTLNRNTAVAVLDAVFEADGDVDDYVKENHLTQILSEAQVEGEVVRVLATHQKSIADYHAGKERAFGFLVGQVMRGLGGKASPQLVNELVRQILDHE